MRRYVPALLLLAACSADPESAALVHDGLGFDGSSLTSLDGVTSAQLTLRSQMPVLGDAVFTGTYEASVGSNTGGGAAQVLADWTNGDVNLVISGDWSGIIQGRIDGNKIVDQANQSGTLTGAFYGPDAETTAGSFDAPLTASQTIKGTYLATR